MKKNNDPLSRRERQIMDALFALGEAPVTGIREAMADPPTENAVRTLLQILEDKGHVKRRKDGRHFLFAPKQNRKRAGQRAFDHVLETFFEGSIESPVAAHFVGKKCKVDSDTYQRLRDLIDAAADENQGNQNQKGKK